MAIAALIALSGCAEVEMPIPIDEAVGARIPGTDDEGECAVEEISAEEAAIVAKSGVHAADGPPLTVFLNGNGGTYRSGANDAANNRSSIISGTRRVPPYERGDASWQELVECVRENYARFNVHITDVEPAGGRYMEAVIGGHPGNIGKGSGIGGIAPINTSSCRPIETGIGYVFSRNLGSQSRLCKTTSHEIGHMLSLEHEYLCEDPMTYLSGCGRKTFQDQEVWCGTYSSRRCACRGGKQNTVQAIYDLVGAHNNEPLPDPEDDLGPPVVELETPEDRSVAAENGIVTVVARASDDTRMGRVELVWDHNGERYGCPTSGQYVDCTRQEDRYQWTVQVGTGQRTFRVRALDFFGKETETESRTVLLTPEGMRPPELDDETPPSIQVVGPDGGLGFRPNSEIMVEATVADDGELAMVQLLWGFNGEEYPCPTSGRYVSCVVVGDVHRWTVSVGSEAARPFQIRARDTAGRITTTDERTVYVNDADSAPEPPEAPPPEDPPEAPPPEDPPEAPPAVPPGPEPPPEAPPAPEPDPEDPPAPEPPAEPPAPEPPPEPPADPEPEDPPQEPAPPSR